MNTISAPILDGLITKAQSCPDLLSQTDKEVLLCILEKMQCVAICGNDERRELWLTTDHGSIEDFGDYDDYLENEIVENRDDFEKIWKEEYPDLIKWYLFSVTHYNGEYFFFVDNRLTLHIKKEEPYSTESLNTQLISLVFHLIFSTLSF